MNKSTLRASKTLQPLREKKQSKRKGLILLFNALREVRPLLRSLKEHRTFSVWSPLCCKKLVLCVPFFAQVAGELGAADPRIC